MREALQIVLRRFQPRILEGPADAFPALSGLWREAMDDQRFGDDLFDGLGWIERLVRILKNHLDPLADFLALLVGGMCNVDPFEKDTALRCFLKAHQCQRQGRLAAAALADQGDHLPAA